MYPSTEPTLPSAAHPNQAANVNNAQPSNSNYVFLSSPPKIKRKPQPIATRCSPPRSIPRAISRRQSSISVSPSFQTSFFSITPTPATECPYTPQLASYGYTASFATFPSLNSLPHVQGAQIPLTQRVPSSPKRGHTTGSPKRSLHRSPSSPFAPPSPTRTRSRAKSTTTRSPLPTQPPQRASKLSKIRSLASLRSRSPSPVPPLPATSIMPIMITSHIPTPKVTSKHAKRSATPARNSIAFTKYRPMPFIQQMQMRQFMEGGTLDSHIRRHHAHAGRSTEFATGAKEDVAHGYPFTDERGMIWFDEEEEWEFTSLIPRMRLHPRKGKKSLGKRRDEQIDDEWEDFVQDEEVNEDMDLEVLLAREDDALRARDDDLASFGGALEGSWAEGRPGSSVLKLPKSKNERKRKLSGRTILSIPSPLPEPMLVPTHPQKEVVALRNEFLATAFTPTRTSAKQFRTTNPPIANATPGGQTLASVATDPLRHAPPLAPALDTRQRTLPPTVSPSPAAVSLQSSAYSIKKQTFKSLRGCFKTTKGN